MWQKVKSMMLLVSLLCLISGCTYNPFSAQNRLTGSVAGTAIGAGVGAGSLALLGAPRWGIILGGLGGGAIGYYVTTLRYDAGGVIAVGGQVYQLGDFVGIDIPTDYLFQSNTARFLPFAPLVLDSALTVINRYGCHSITVADNTSGFDRSFREKRLSTERARKVLDYFRKAGLSAFQEASIDLRRLN